MNQNKYFNPKCDGMGCSYPDFHSYDCNRNKNKQQLYDSIKDVIDGPTRNILYIQFIAQHYPEAFDVFKNGGLEYES